MVLRARNCPVSVLFPLQGLCLSQNFGNLKCTVSLILIFDIQSRTKKSRQTCMTQVFMADFDKSEILQIGLKVAGPGSI